MAAKSATCLEAPERPSGGLEVPPSPLGGMPGPAGPDQASDLADTHSQPPGESGGAGSRGTQGEEQLVVFASGPGQPLGIEPEPRARRTKTRRQGEPGGVELLSHTMELLERAR